MTNEEADKQELERQLRVATEAIREAVLRLLRTGEVHPQLVVLAVARVTGELGASAALAGGEDIARLLRELAEVVRSTGLEHQETLRAETLPVAGSA
jgi:hypothetical protein